MSPARARRRLLGTGLLLLWLLVLVVAGPFAGRLTEVEKNDNAAFLPKTAESTEVNELQQRFVDQDTTPAILVWERPDGITDSDLTSIRTDLTAVQAVPRVVAVSEPIQSQDHRAVQAIVQRSRAPTATS